MNICKTFHEFETALRKHEMDNKQKFVIGDYGRKIFASKEIEITKDLRLHWQDGVPYFHFGTRTYACHYGKDYNVFQKKHYTMKRDAKAESDHCFIKRQRKVQVSKKLDCPATIHVTRAYRLPNYKISGSVTRSKKARISSLIKKKIADNEDLEGEEGYIFNLPSADDHHNHFVGKLASATEPIRTNVLKDEPLENKVSFNNLEQSKLRSSNKKLLINKFNANVRSLKSLVWNLNEENIRKCSTTLENLFNEMSTKVETNNITGLPITNTTKKVNRKRTVADV